MAELWMGLPWAARVALEVAVLAGLPMLLGARSSTAGSALLGGGAVGLLASSAVYGPQLLHVMRRGAPLDLGELSLFEIYAFLARPIIGATVVAGLVGWAAYGVKRAVSKPRI